MTRNFKNCHHPRIRALRFLGARKWLTDEYILVIDGEKGVGVELFYPKDDPGQKNKLEVDHPFIVKVGQKTFVTGRTQFSTKNYTPSPSVESRVVFGPLNVNFSSIESPSDARHFVRFGPQRGALTARLST